MRALVTGGHGFVGSYVVEELFKKGFEVVCLIRNSSDLRWIKHLPVHYYYADIRDKNSFQGFPKNLDYVYHIAGLIKAKAPQDFFQVNQYGTLYFLKACLEQNPNLKRFVLVSSVAATGPSSSLKPKIELDPETPISIYGKSKLGGEKVLKEHIGNTPYTIIRPPAVFGPRDTGMFTFFKTIKKLKGLFLLKPKKRFYSFIHAKDLAEAIVGASLSENTKNQTYHIVNDQIYPFEYVVNLISKEFSQKPRIYFLPNSLVLLAAKCADLYMKIFKKPTHFNSMKLPELQASYWIFSPQKAFHDFGWKNKISLEDCIQETAKWYLDNGWL